MCHSWWLGWPYAVQDYTADLERYSALEVCRRAADDRANGSGGKAFRFPQLRRRC